MVVLNESYELHDKAQQQNEDKMKKYSVTLHAHEWGEDGETHSFKTNKFWLAKFGYRLIQKLFKRPRFTVILYDEVNNEVYHFDFDPQ